MYDVYYIYRSVTHGQMGQAALERNRIPSVLIRSPRELAPSGCAYALTLRSRDEPRAFRLLSGEGVRPVDRFRRNTGGAFQRIVP